MGVDVLRCLEVDWFYRMMNNLLFLNIFTYQKIAFVAYRYKTNILILDLKLFVIRYNIEGKHLDAAYISRERRTSFCRFGIHSWEIDGSNNK